MTPPFGDRTRPVGLAPDDAEDVSVGLGLVCGWGYYKVKLNGRQHDDAFDLDIGENPLKIHR